MRKNLQLIPIIPLFALTACSPSPGTAPTAATRTGPVTVSSPGSPKETIHLSDPNGDLTAALAKNDHRFIGIMGYALTVPAITTEPQRALLDKYGVKTIDGLTDVETGSTASLRQPAHDYAEKYNTALLKKLAPP